MKKFTRTGKKALSFFLSVLMVLTTWVFVAPEKALAATMTAGSYEVDITYWINNEGVSLSKEYKGEASLNKNDDHKNQMAGFSLYYKTNNGTGTEEEVWWNIGQNTKTCGKIPTNSKASVTKPTGYIDDSTKTDYHAKATIPGFPTRLFACLDYDTNWSSKCIYTIKSIKVNGTAIWAAKTGNKMDEAGLYLNSTSYLKYVTLNSDYSWTGNDKSNAKVQDVQTSASAWSFPKATKVVWSPAPSNITIPNNTTGTSYCVDQYGVKLACDPTYSFSPSPITGVSGSRTLAANGASYKITADNEARMTGHGNNEKTVTMKATYTFGGQTATTNAEKTFKLIDPKYKITFEGNGGTVSPTYYNVYYGESLNSQSGLDGNVSTYPVGGNRPGYTFIGLFDKATGGNLMNPDENVTAAKTYYAHWEVNKYVAVFWNRMHDEVVHIENNIPYGTDITSAGEEAASKLPDEYDEAYHYKFTGWDTKLTSVTGNLVNIWPKYTAVKHTFTTSSVPANCAHGAGTEYRCTECGYTRVESTGQPTGNHTWGDSITVTKDPTCTATGEGYRTCTVCGAHSETETVPATGHTYKVEKKDATCTAEGYIKYTCSKGDDTHTETLPKVAHVMVEGTKHTATCGNAGYTEMHCQNCGGEKYNKYTDAATGKHNWVINSTVSHNSVTVNGECSVCHATFTKTVDTTHELTGVQSQTPATCQTAGKVVLKCAVSGCTKTHEITLDKNPNAHTGYTSTVTDATCTATGTVTTKCTACVVTVATATIPATGHNFDSSKVTKEATCTESGVRTYTCSKCHTTKTETIAKLEHKFVETPATCLKDGSKKCALCGYTVTIESEGHKLGNWETLKVATCKDNGIEVQKCTVCGQIQDVRTTEKLTNHSFSDWTTYQPATCTSKGVKTKTCSVCGKVEMDYIPALGHAYSDTFTTDYEATCISNGQKSKHCTREGCEARAEITVIEKRGHNITTTTTPATCTEVGKTVEKCSRCDYEKTTSIQPINHELVTTPVAGNCGNAGYTEVTCKNCDLNYKIDFVQATGEHTWVISQTTSHDKTVVSGKCSVCDQTFGPIEVTNGHKFTKYEETKKATCKVDGIITVKCADANCNESYTINIGKGAHTGIKTTVINPTCTATGKVTTVCETCGETVYAEQTIPMNNHNWKAEITKKATCKEAGILTYTCETCKTAKTESIPIDSNAHNFVKGSELQPATCTTPAYYVYTCANGCGKTYNEYTGNATGHNWTVASTSQSGTKLTITCKCSSCGETHEETVTVAEGHNYTTVTSSTAATCKNPGSVTIACDKQHDSSCTAVITVAVPVDSTAHDYEFTYTPPTCKAEGVVSVICKNCGERLHDNVVIAKLEHSWNDGEVTKKADCDTNGGKTYTCTVEGCGATKTEVIPMTGHKWNSGEHKDATCTMGGYTHFTCEVCQKTYDVIDKDAKANGHTWNDGIETKAATCTEDGEKLYTCSKCNETKTEVIPKLGHDLQATEEVVAPTCTTSGYTVYKCTRCDDYTFNVIDSSKPATGHSYKWTYDHASKTVTGTCANNCGSTVTYTISDGGTEHSFTVQSYTVPKCNANGELVLKCTKTGCTKTETITLESEGTEHNYETVITLGKNCEDKGSAVTKCTYCGDIKETVEIPAKGHNYGDPVYHEATCTSKEYNEYTCEKCGDKKVVFVKDSEPTGHHFTQTASTATCTKAGTITVSCAACGISETVNVPALGHDFVATDDVVASTCKEVGHTVYKCSHCDETKTVYSGEIGEHKWSGYEPVQTATADRCGIEKRTCSECGAVDYKITNSTGDHNYTDTRTKEPTCTEEGVITRHCNSHSDEADQLIPIPATGHTVVTDPATPADCTTPGTTAKVYCEKRDMVYLESKTVAALGHRYEVKSVENATCKYAAKVTLECTVCHDETTVSQGTVGNHSYTMRSAENDISATCTADGYEAWKCATCDDIKYVKSTTATATGHKVDATKTVKVAATCSTPGIVSEFCHCGVLMGVAVSEPDATKHDFTVVKTVTAKEGCLESGYSYTVCSNCGAVKEDSIKVDGAKDHEYAYIVDKAATCEEAGSAHFECKTCDSKLPAIELPMLQHTYDEGVETKKATCQAEGEVTFTCKECGDKLTAKTSKTLHDYEAGEIVPATCSKSSYQVYKCKNENCDATYNVIVEGPLANHNYELTSTKETCTTDGTYKYVCSECHASYEYTVPATGHKFTKLVESNSSTCKEVGYKKYQCANDGCTAETTVYEATLAEHQFGDWEVVAEATTEKAGLKIRTCSVCGLAEKETISPIGDHKFAKVEDGYIAPICTKEGSQKWYCTIHENCSANYTEVIPATGHTPVADEAVAATCTGEGKTAGSHCSVCNAVIVAQQTIPAKNHNYGNIPSKYEPATCRKEGSVTLKCADCEAETTVTIEKNPDAHKMVEDPDNSQKATCKHAAYTAYKCDNEGCTYTYKQWTSDPTDHTAKDDWTVKKAATCSGIGYEVLECKGCGTVMDTREIPADVNLHNWNTITEKAGHTKSGYSYEQCQNCGAMRNFKTEDLIKHEYTERVAYVPATPEANGSVTYKCSCGDVKTFIIPATGCKFKENTDSYVAPTCETDGTKYYVCTIHTDCENNYEETVPALGHKADDVKVTPATCMSEGSAVVTCQRDGCGKELSNVKIAMLPHTFNEKSEQVVVNPTCQKAGSITYTCTTEGCEAKFVVTLNKGPHDFKKTDSVEPTCLDSGYDVYKCTTEGCDSSYVEITRSANGHRYKIAEKIEPTCSTNGHVYYKCAYCDDAEYDYEIPATGNHSYTEPVTVDAKCETAGYTYNKCTDCDAVDKDSIKAIDPLGHDYSVDNGDGTVSCSRTGCDSKITVEKVITDEDGTHAFEGKITKQSTCKERGTIEYTCRTHKNCAKNHTEELPLAAHAANADSVEVIDPKCNNDGTTTDGSVVIKCAACGEVLKTITIKAAHDYKVVKVERATCASEGTVTERCTVCGHERTSTIDINGAEHSFVVEETVPATCTTDGYTVYKCECCDLQKFEKGDAKLGHRDQNTVTVNPTCKNDGYIRTTCEDCNAIIEEKVIKASGHTKVTERKEPTCKESGSVITKCEKCGKVTNIEILNRTEHTWGEWKVVEGSNCQTEGSRTRECTFCHETETVNTGKGEHVYPKEGTKVEPTCESDGYTVFKCEVCGNTLIKDYIPKSGHKYSSDYRIVIEPTCHSTGSKAHYCVNCNAIEPEHNEAYVDIPRLPHKYGEWTITVEPTCENTGIRTRSCVNEGCPEGFEGHTQTEVLGRLGHHYGDWEIAEESTCNKAGTQRRYCDRCKTWETQTLPLGKHKRVADPEVAATCDKTGLTAGSHCEVCGKVFVEQEVIPKTNHMDLGGDGKCDICGKVMTDKTGKDTCFCHGTGFRALVYRFVRVIWKLFKVNQYCTCGVKHW